MSRRSRLIRNVALAIAVVAPLSVPFAAHAEEASKPPPIDAKLEPCPLTEEELAGGKRTVDRAVRTLETAVLRLGPTTESGPTSAPRTSTWDRAQLCALALADIDDKRDELNEALGRYATCLVQAIFTGQSCAAERYDADAAQQSLEVAVHNLQFTCPWLAVF